MLVLAWLQGLLLSLLSHDFGQTVSSVLSKKREMSYVYLSNAFDLKKRNTDLKCLATFQRVCIDVAWRCPQTEH
jgi:hypothetical protein